MEQPRTGYGSGVHLFLMLDSPTEASGTLARCQRVGEDSSCMTNRYGKDEIDHGIRTFPTEAMAGQLMVRRQEKVLRFLKAEDFTSEPEQIDEREIGLEDVKMIRLAANTGGKSPSALDVRLLDFPIRCSPSSDPDGGSGASALAGDASPRPRSRVWLALAGMGMIVLITLGVVLFLTQRKGPGPVPAKKTVVAETQRPGKRET